MTATQYDDFRHLLRCISERLQTLEPFDIEGQPAQAILNSAMLTAGRLRIWFDGFGHVNVDCKRLNYHSLLALRRDPGVALSARREIDAILKIRSLERAIDRVFLDVDDAGETGAIYET